MASAQPILEVKNLSRHFGGLAAVNAVSFEVREGQIFGFIGPNGAGKTTLFSLIAGAIPPTEGAVVMRGKEITTLKAHQRVKVGVARTHQIVRPFREMTVLENVEVGIHFGREGKHTRKSAKDSAMEILRRVGLEAVAGSTASILSVGNQKRLELARAIATQPALLLCDEICGGLTHSETAAILELLRSFRANGTTIMYVEHDVKAITSVCDRVLVLNYGRKLAEGTPEHIQNDPAVIEAYLGTPATGTKR